MWDNGPVVEPSPTGYSGPVTNTSTPAPGQGFGTNLGDRSITASEVLGLHIDPEFAGMFYNYDPTKEKMEQGQFNLQRRAANREMLGLNQAFNMGASKRGFASHGGANFMQQIAQRGVGDQLEGQRIASRARIFGFREDYRDDIYDRYMDLLATGAEPFEEGIDPDPNDINIEDMGGINWGGLINGLSGLGDFGNFGGGGGSII